LVVSDKEEPVDYGLLLTKIKRALGYGPTEIHIDGIDVYEDYVVMTNKGAVVGKLTIDRYHEILDGAPDDD